VSEPTTPTPAQPPRDLVHAVAGPLWQQRGVITKILSALVGLPALLDKLRAIPGLTLPTWVANALLIASIVGWFVASILGASDSSDSAARAALRGPGDGTVSGAG
jgi:hypothetical protein